MGIEKSNIPENLNSFKKLSRIQVEKDALGYKLFLVNDHNKATEFKLKSIQTRNWVATNSKLKKTGVDLLNKKNQAILAKSEVPSVQATVIKYAILAQNDQVLLYLRDKAVDKTINRLAEKGLQQTPYNSGGA